MAIHSFGQAEAREFYQNGTVKRRLGWAGVANIVARKLDMIHYAVALEDLRSPPGNRLEKLKGNLQGLYSIRINDQWRIVFRWADGGAHEVRVLDYHS